MEGLGKFDVRVSGLDRRSSLFSFSHVVVHASGLLWSRGCQERFLTTCVLMV